jgi:hypothetical protein
VEPLYGLGSCIATDPACAADDVIILGIKENAKPSFSIVPNPSSKNITITAANHFHTIEVDSFLGQTVYSQPHTGNKATLDVSNYPNGIYFVRIISDNGVCVNKFVKQ